MRAENELISGIIVAESKPISPRFIDSCVAECRIGGAEVILEIAGEWNELCDQGASDDPFLRPEWFQSLIETFEMEIHLFTVRKLGELVAVLPMMKCIETIHGIPVRKLKGVFNLESPRFDLIHTNDDSHRTDIILSIWSAMRAQSTWDTVEFRLVKKNSWMKDLLTLAGNANFKTGIWSMDSAPFLELPDGQQKEDVFSAYISGLSSSRRRALKKNQRLLEEYGKVEYFVTKGFSDHLLKKYFELEANSWKARNGTAITSNEKVADLYEKFSSAPKVSENIIFHELRLNNQTIAMCLCIKAGKKTVAWKNSYNEEYAKCSPGNLLLLEVLKECIQNGSEVIDFLAPESYNKSKWTKAERHKAAFYIFRKGIFGNLLWSWKFKLISYIRKYKKRDLLINHELNGEAKTS